MKDYFLKLYNKLSFFIPISVVIIVVTVLITIFSIKSITKSINELSEKSLMLELEAINKMFEREYEIKTELVKEHLKLIDYLFNKSNLIYEKKNIEKEIINQFTLEKQTVVLNDWLLDGKSLFEDNSFVDTVNSLVGGTATIFQKTDYGYIRISTNVMSDENERAVSTYIPINSPVIEKIEKGEEYYGRAFVVNDWYITGYKSIIKNEKIIGMLYVGFKEKDLNEFKNLINRIKIGKTGYVYAMDTVGNIIIGFENSLYSKPDSVIIKKVTDTKNGILKNKEADGTEKLISFKYFEGFDLIIVAEINQDVEVEELKANLMKNAIVFAVISIFIFIIIIFLITYQNIRHSNKKVIQTKEALLISEKKYETLFDYSSDEIYVIDLSGNFIEVNQVACSTLGYTRDEFLKKNIIEIKKGNFRNKVYENLDKIKEFGEHTYETVHVSKDGKVMNVEMKSRMIDYQGKKVILIVARNTDERKATEKQIISTVIQTEEKERKKFAADLHDELGPILSTIKLYSDLLISKPVLDTKSKELIKDIDGLTDMAISTTKDLQNRITPAILHDFGLATAVQEFCNYINKTKSIKIEVNTENYTPVAEKIIETIIFQVIKELIHNTIKHAKATKIKIELKILNNQLILYYKDNGIGFNLESLSNNTTGLGINNIVNKIRTINGNCDFNSSVDNGMFVLISLKLNN